MFKRSLSDVLPKGRYKDYAFFTKKPLKALARWLGFEGFSMFIFILQLLRVSFHE